MNVHTVYAHKAYHSRLGMFLLLQYPQWLHIYSIFSRTQHVLKFSTPNTISVPSQPQNSSTKKNSWGLPYFEQAPYSSHPIAWILRNICVSSTAGPLQQGPHPIWYFHDGIVLDKGGEMSFGKCFCELCSFILEMCSNEKWRLCFRKLWMCVDTTHQTFRQSVYEDGCFSGSANYP